LQLPGFTFVASDFDEPAILACEQRDGIPVWAMGLDVRHERRLDAETFGFDLFDAATLRTARVA
jgi:hypothetical protein